ncbi:SdrH family protein [Mammaliicoccus stepanovicii]|uniref:SdrH family protein n=1 Tax=Mammaliicoccus stepanovicii TaxID=643214 RepID=UPI00197DF6C4|nr:SdrH family protein [Mammaliicoccus stepanovicii]
MKMMKNAILSSILISSAVLGISMGDDMHAQAKNNQNTTETSPKENNTTQNNNIEKKPVNNKDNQSTEEPSTSEKPTTEEPPTSEKPTTEEPPTREKPSTEEPPTGEKPTTEEPPTGEKPSTEEPPTGEKPSTEEPPTSEKPTTEEPPTGEKPSTEEPNTDNHNQLPPPNSGGGGNPPSTESKTNESSNLYNGQTNIEQQTPTTPYYPNTNEIGSYTNKGQAQSDETPKFIPGKSDAYYNKMDQDVLDLVTSKVGTRPDLANPKFKRHSKTTETTLVNDNTDTKTTTTEEYKNVSNNKDTVKPVVIGISLVILLLLIGIAILFIRKIRHN